RLRGVRLVGADDAGRTALDPSGGVLAHQRLLGPGIEHAALVVQDDAPALVERHARQGYAAIADRTEHQTDRNLLETVGGARLQGPRRRRVELVAHQTHPGDTAGVVPDQLDRRDEKSQDEALGLARNRTPRVLAEDLDLLERGPVLAALDGGSAQRIQLDLCRLAGGCRLRP